MFPGTGMASRLQDEREAVLARLHSLTSSIVTLRCVFTQRTEIPLFAGPVMSKGRMLFRAPGGLAWEISEPMREGFVINGEYAYRWEENKSRRHAFRTSEEPLAALIGKQIHAWIAFDRKWIESRYSITVEELEPIRFSLTPKNSEWTAVVTSIGITFEQSGMAKSVELRQADGGRTLIEFDNIRVNIPLDDREFE
jgi:outer membrane lipoprotein-sorting protein